MDKYTIEWTRTIMNHTVTLLPIALAVRHIQGIMGWHGQYGGVRLDASCCARL